MPRNPDSPRKIHRLSLYPSFGFQPERTQTARGRRSLAAGKSEEEILALEDLKGLAPFKYTYTSGAGLIALMLDNELKPEDTIAKWSAGGLRSFQTRRCCFEIYSCAQRFLRHVVIAEALPRIP